MTDLAGISGKEAMRKFIHLGYAVIRQKGSHVRLKHFNPDSHPPLTIPMHKEIKVGLMRRLIKDAGVAAEEFLKL